MSNKVAGVIFCCIAAFIFVIPYFTVVISTFGAIISPSVFIGFFGKLCVLSIAISAFMLVIGIICFSMAEKKLSVKSTKENASLSLTGLEAKIPVISKDELKTIVKNLGLSQRQFANRFGVSQQMISDILNGKRKMTKEISIKAREISTEALYVSSSN